VVIILIVPPTNDLVVFSLVGTISLSVLFGVLSFFSKKYAISLAVFTIVLLTTNYFIGFQVLSTILLLSGIIGVLFII